MHFNPDQADKRGYLTEPFRLFSLRARESGEIANHYHEFHKLLFFRSGDVTYRVEGRSYPLSGGEVLLVPAHAIHQPLISPDTPYERLVLWVQPEAVEQRGLERCFDHCTEEKSYLLPRDRCDQGRLTALLRDLEQSVDGGGFGCDALAEGLFLQLMVWLNRWTLEGHGGDVGARGDPKIDEILSYINDNLTEDLSVGALAGKFYLSRSWLMHRFKAITGCSIHQYVLQKRLILAAQQLRQGVGVAQAAQLSGFSDYSAFLRSFRKAYGVSPREFR